MYLLFQSLYRRNERFGEKWPVQRLWWELSQQEVFSVQNCHLVYLSWITCAINNTALIAQVISEPSTCILVYLYGLSLVRLRPALERNIELPHGEEGREVEGAAGCDWTAGDQKNTFLAPKEREEEALSRFSVEELAAAGQVSLSLSLSLPSCPDTYLKASLFCQNISHILDKAVVLLKCLCVAREPSLGNIHPRGR